MDFNLEGSGNNTLTLSAQKPDAEEEVLIHKFTLSDTRSGQTVTEWSPAAGFYADGSRYNTVTVLQDECWVKPLGAADVGPVQSSGSEVMKSLSGLVENIPSGDTVYIHYPVSSGLQWVETAGMKALESATDGNTAPLFLEDGGCRAVWAASTESEENILASQLPPQIVQEHVWADDGPLGMKLTQQFVFSTSPDYVFVEAVAPFLPEALKGLVVGTVAGSNVANASHDEVMALLNSAQRPLTVGFTAAKLLKHTWTDAGPLGLKLTQQGSSNQSPGGVFVEDAAPFVPANIKGMLLQSIAGEDVSASSYDDVMVKLQAASRPFTAFFAPKPQPSRCFSMVYAPHALSAEHDSYTEVSLALTQSPNAGHDFSYDIDSNDQIIVGVAPKTVLADSLLQSMGTSNHLFKSAYPVIKCLVNDSLQVHSGSSADDPVVSSLKRVTRFT